jgi:hypothetical protein
VDWAALLFLTFIGILVVAVVMLGFRLAGRPERLPSWVPLTGMLVTGTLLAVSVLASEWLQTVIYALNLATFALLFVAARRPPP